MQVAFAPICPPDNAQNGLSPELLAAVGARYSRSSDGYQQILASIKGQRQDVAVDRIFKFVDYGHASIADMVPVPMFFDSISMLLAFVMFNLCQQQAGQECSTRYIDADKFPDEWIHGDGARDAEISRAMRHMYRASVEILSNAAPVANDEQQDKKSERMRRNWAYDRARVYLPFGAITGCMMIQSAREWARLSMILSNAPGQLPEFRQAGRMIREQLSIASPRMEHMCQGDPDQEAMWQEWLTDYLGNLCEDVLEIPYITPLWSPKFRSQRVIRKRRRDPVPAAYATSPVELHACPRIGEARDLNRHRPGGRTFAWMRYFSPVGAAPWESISTTPIYLNSHDEWYRQHTSAVFDELRTGNLTALYRMPLGAHCRMTISTQLDKAIYLSELRMARGAHPGYAAIAKLWARQLADSGAPICDSVRSALAGATESTRAAM